MKMRMVLSLLVLTGAAAGMLNASERSTKKSMKKGTSFTCDDVISGKKKLSKKKDSFVMRGSCARTAMMQGDTEKAFELMGPIYQEVKTGKSNVKGDLRFNLLDIVNIAIGKENGAMLLNKYKGVSAEELYTAVALAYNIDPQTGTTLKGGKKRHYVLPVGLEADIKALVASASYMEEGARLGGIEWEPVGRSEEEEAYRKEQLKRPRKPSSAESKAAVESQVRSAPVEEYEGYGQY